MDPRWSDLIRDALQEALHKTRNTPVGGSRLSQIVKRLAGGAGLDFLPAGISSFREFIEQFPDIALIHERPGRDIQVVPKDKPELLSETPERGGSNRLREDVFVAFTRIPNSASQAENYYFPATGQIGKATDPNAPEQGIKIPPSNLEIELAERKAFAQSDRANLSNDQVAQLLSTLEEPQPLRSFSVMLKSLNRSSNWHAYRMALVLGRVKRWADENGVQWSPDWVVDGRQQDSAQGMRMHEVSSTASNLLIELANVVTEADCARISVPLDLILRLRNRRA